MGRFGRKTLAAVALMAATSVLSGPAHAASVGYQLDIFGNINFPTFKLTNLAATADIVGFNFTIGDISRNFDGIAGIVPGGITSTLNRPDLDVDGGLQRSDDIAFTFTSGFMPGSMFQFDADVDIDSSNSGENFTTVFFNNGTDNSVITVTYLDGQMLTLTLPENPFVGVNNLVSFSQQTVIPLPAAFPLFLSALIGLGWVAWRKQHANQ